jgi:cyanate lyase
MLTNEDAGQAIRLAEFRCGVSWKDIAEAIGRDPVWTVAALLGQHPMSAAEATTAAQMLGLGDEVFEALQLPPYRGSDVGGGQRPGDVSESLLLASLSFSLVRTARPLPY